MTQTVILNYIEFSETVPEMTGIFNFLNKFSWRERIIFKNQTSSHYLVWVD